MADTEIDMAHGISDSSSSEDELDPEAIYLQMKRDLAKAVPVSAPKPHSPVRSPARKSPVHLAESEDEMTDGMSDSSSSEHELNTHTLRKMVRRAFAKSDAEAFAKFDAESRPDNQSPVESPARNVQDLFLDDESGSEPEFRVQARGKTPVDEFESGSDVPDNPRFRALVAKSRAERAEQIAKERDITEDTDEEREADNLMTQQSKPTRKASKRAIELMNRETQRMSRNMQLAHQPKVKQKHTMRDFMKRFQAARPVSVPVRPATPPLTPPNPRIDDELPDVDSLLTQPKTINNNDDDDNDLEIIKDQPSVFDKIKPRTINQSRGQLTVRHLASLGFEPVKGMTPDQLNYQLLRRARLQARRERDEKIAALKAKGVVVLSAEERERDQEALENMLDKARQDADELRKREKLAVTDELDLVASGDESDDDYAGSVELSGSEDEPEDEADEQTETETETEIVSRKPKRRIIDDDEDDSPTVESQSQDELDTPAVEIESHPRNEHDPPAMETNSESRDELDDVAAALGRQGPPMNLSQMFAGTMGCSQTQANTPMEDSMDVFTSLVPRQLDMEVDVVTQDQVVHTPMSYKTVTYSQIPTPSQDVGFTSPVLTRGLFTTVDSSRVTEVQSTRPVKSFDKKRSEAKTMVDEQAEESEDEYAGLGGVSDDDSGDDEVVKELIDDETAVNIDKNQIAAYYAEKARVDNEAQTSKLYKDIMSGALRRQRDGAFDLGSDDEDEIVERRRRRQREEARKRRLLLGDEQLGKFDGDARKEAFLRTIEDREDDQDDDLLDGKDIEQDSSQERQQQQQQPFESVSGNAQKRKAQDEPRPSKRRVLDDAFRKPASLDEVRESVSFLVEDTRAEQMVELSDSDNEAELPERAPYSARRTAPALVDRLVLRTNSSTRSSCTGAAVPSLLRRATTNNMAPPPLPLKHSSSSSGMFAADDAIVRRGGSKKSSINYAAREAERRALVDLADKARVDKVRKIAGIIRGANKGHLGTLGGLKGGFE